MAAKLKMKICINCGRDFLGKGALYCPDCKTERKSKSNKNLETKETQTKLLQYKLKNIGTFREDVCPNIDKTSMMCAVCPAGAWKFKDCGRE